MAIQASRSILRTAIQMLAHIHIEEMKKRVSKLSRGEILHRTAHVPRCQIWTLLNSSNSYCKATTEEWTLIKYLIYRSYIHGKKQRMQDMRNSPGGNCERFKQIAITCNLSSYYLQRSYRASSLQESWKKWAAHNLTYVRSPNFVWVVTLLALCRGDIGEQTWRSSMLMKFQEGNSEEHIKLPRSKQDWA
jgi:hypothetical protein